MSFGGGMCFKFGLTWPAFWFVYMNFSGWPELFSVVSLHQQRFIIFIYFFFCLHIHFWLSNVYFKSGWLWFLLNQITHIFSFFFYLFVFIFSNDFMFIPFSFLFHFFAVNFASLLKPWPFEQKCSLNNFRLFWCRDLIMCLELFNLK